MVRPVGLRTWPGGAAAVLLVLGAIVGVALATAATPANAGTYTARFCTEGATEAGDNGPFERSGNQTVFQLTNACGNVNGLRVSHIAGNPGNEGIFGRWLATAPDSVAVTGIDYKAKGADQAGGYFPQVIGTVPGGGIGVINGGQDLAGTFKDFSVSGDVRSFGVQVVCETGGSACAADPPGTTEASLKSMTYDLRDDAAPAIAGAGGSLFEAPVQVGAQSVSFDASDDGSGVYRAIVVANGDDAAAVAGDCDLGDGFALSFRPCPGSFADTIPVNTAAPPWRNGGNRVKLCVEDYSAGSRVCTGATDVRVLNGCAASPAPPLGVGRTMELGWPGQRGVVRSRQGRARKATARLFGQTGEPLAGAAICFSRSIPTDKAAKERVIEPGAVTGADGRAAVEVRGHSSRAVWATYWVDPETVITKRIELRVSPAVRLELRTDGDAEVGEKVRAVGLLRGKWKSDRKVCFYTDKSGSDRFACDSTGRGGRARVGYEPDEPGKLHFYAKVPNQRNYPYTRGRSKTKSVEVQP
jgi:hypothetical protein